MKEKTLFCMAALLVGSMAVYAGPKEDVSQAAKKLAKAGTYTWKTTTEGGFRTAAPTVGKMGKDGMAVISMPRRDTTMEIVIQGEKAAVQTQDGWQSLSDLENNTEQGNRGRFLAMMVRRFKPPAAEVEALLKQAGDLTMANENLFRQAHRKRRQGDADLPPSRGRQRSRSKQPQRLREILGEQRPADKVSIPNQRHHVLQWQRTGN